jgi:hypothetical protein
MSSPRHFSEHRAQQRFQRNMQLLDLELTMGTARRHLDVLVELLEQLVEQCGHSLLSDGYRSELAHAKRRVASRGNLRLVSPS